MTDFAPFWFVWNPDNRPPAFKHPSLQSAEIEACRLARENRGQAFIVLESVKAICVADIQETNMRPEPEIPF